VTYTRLCGKGELRFSEELRLLISWLKQGDYLGMSGGPIESQGNLKVEEGSKNEKLDKTYQCWFYNGGRSP
jgi:hypothetical protein